MFLNFNNTVQTTTSKKKRLIAYLLLFDSFLLALGLVVFLYLRTTGVANITEIEIIKKQTSNLAVAEDKQTSQKITQWLLKDRVRYDFNDNESIISDFSSGKSYSIQWQQKKVQEFAAVENSEPLDKKNQLQKLAKAPCFTNKSTKLCDHFQLHSSSGDQIDIYASKASGLLEQRALQAQSAEAQDYLLELSTQDSQLLVRRIDVVSAKEPNFTQSTQELSRRIYWAGLFSDLSFSKYLPSQFRWPEEFVTNRRIQDLQSLPPEVRESILRQQNVQILEAKPTQEVTPSK